jgi:osmotically-inducible protein OsmY
VDGDPDFVMARRIRAKMRRSGAVHEGNVDVDVIDGEVYLSGIVESDRERKAAVSIAGDVARVDGVHDQMTVENQPG